MDDALLLPIELAVPHSRRLPSPSKVEMTRRERVDLLLIRHRRGFLLWNPADKINHHEMSKDMAPLAERTDDGHDCAVRMLTLAEIDQIVTEKQVAEHRKKVEQRARRKGAA